MQDTGYLSIFLDFELGLLGLLRALRTVIVVAAALLGVTVSTLEVLTTLLPVAVVGRAIAVAAIPTVVTIVEATTATTSSASATTTTSTSMTTAVATESAAATSTARLVVALFLGLEPIRSDALLLALHLAVLLLGHDSQLVVVVFGLRLQSKKLLSGLLAVELNKDATLPGILCIATLANHDSAIWTEELLKRDLANLLTLCGETLDIDRVLSLIEALFEDTVEQFIDGRRVLVVTITLGHNERLLALDCFIAEAVELSIVNHSEMLALAECVHDCGVGLETAHALELAEVLDGHGLVAGSLKFFEEMLVLS